MCGFLGTGGSLVELGRERQESERDGTAAGVPWGPDFPGPCQLGRELTFYLQGSFLTGGVPRSGLLLREPHFVPNALLHYFPKVFGGIKGKGTVLTKPRTCFPVKLTSKGRKGQPVGFRRTCSSTIRLL